MADLLGDNLKAPEVELQTYLDSGLLVSSSKKQIQEITDIVTWVKALAVCGFPAAHTLLDGRA